MSANAIANVSVETVVPSDRIADAIVRMVNGEHSPADPRTGGHAGQLESTGQRRSARSSAQRAQEAGRQAETVLLALAGAAATTLRHLADEDTATPEEDRLAG